MGASPALAVDGISIGRRFNDGLDSRYSVSSFTSAARSTGYAASGYQNGRSADDAFLDGSRSAVFGLFGHSNAGIFQVNEGPTDKEDQILAAGTTTDVVSPYANIRFMTEYLPYVEVDDMRLLILAGCYTANSGPLGNFNAAAVSRGVDSVITFPGLVYYPATKSSTSVNTTNYSGNYFWSRFSYHVTTGANVATALARARTDLVAKEGNASGWDRYVIRGAVANPGGVTLKPAGAGEPWNSKPLPTQAYSGFSALTPVSASTSDGPGGMSVTEVTTAEGVQYRLRKDGSVLDAIGTSSVDGPVVLSSDKARAMAEDFVRRNIEHFSSEWKLTDEHEISHIEGDALTLLRWRPLQSGKPGSGDLTVEIDRRTGAIVYLSVNRGSADAASFLVTATEAIAAARAAVGDANGIASVEADTWNVSRWIVTIDRGLEGRTEAQVPDVERIEIDARTGQVLSRTTS